MLKFYLLGPPRIELNDEPVQIRRRKALALLVYLAVTGRPHSRDALATLFYPDLDQSQARTYFRRDLGALNTQLRGDWLTADREIVGLNQSAGVWTDLAQFRHDLTACDSHGHAKNDVCLDCLPLLATAADLYTDHFLAGFSLPDCPEFDEWQFFEAENLRQELARALDLLIRGYLAQRQYEQAIPYARRLLNLDPLHELAHRYLMKLYALSGQHAAALRQYDNCVTLLDEELGVAPEEETTRLYEEIKARRFGQLTAQTHTLQPELYRQLPSELPPLGPTVQPLPPFLMEDAEPESAPTVFVGRERELSQLAASLDSARADQGQILFVIGGPGRGKTMLVQEFARRAQDDDPDLVVVRGNCDAITGIGDPYLPFREALIMLAGDVEARWAGGLISQRHARQLWELMPITLPALVEHAPDLIDSLVPSQALRERAATWASKDSPWLNRIAALTADKHRAGLDQKQIFAEYTAVLKAIAAQRPLLLIIEDLHWVDTASSGLLFHLSREVGDSRILLVGTYRPEEVALNRSATSSAGYTEQHPMAGIVSELKRQHGDIWLDLGDLATAEGRHFVDAYLDTQLNRLDEAFREALFRRTEGHALFTVELLRAMQERGDLLQDEDGRWLVSEAIDWATLPVKVEGAIEKRIGRLTKESQASLTIASIQGETFTAEVVARVQGLDERMIVQNLSRELGKRHRLVTAQAIRWLNPGQRRLSIYRFRHHLFQQYLYNRLDEVERGYMHEAVGAVLEGLYEGRTKEVAGQLAHHFQVAGLIPEAISYLKKAGDTAADVYANAEAVAHYARAVELAEQNEIDVEELAHLYTRLGGLLLNTKGDGDPEVGAAYGRAFELYQQVGESPQLFATLRGLAMYHKLHGESETALELTEQMTALANSLQDPALIVESSYALGSLFFYIGEFAPAQNYLEQGISNYDLKQHQSLTSLYGQDPGVANLSYAALNLWVLGYPDRALERYSEALALAEELSHPYSLAMALALASWVSLFRREKHVIREWTEAAISLSVKHDFTLFENVGYLLGGWAFVELGEVDEGIMQMQQSLSSTALTQGAELAPPHLLALLAQSYGKVGQQEKGLDLIVKAQRLINKEREFLWFEAEIYRLKGELLLLCGHSEAEVEPNFQRAIEIARQQRARSFELRAATSLARFWGSQGKQEEARQILANIIDWFTGGFDTLDLIEAKALLDELS